MKRPAKKRSAGMAVIAKLACLITLGSVAASAQRSANPSNTCKHPKSTNETYDCTLSEWATADRALDAYLDKLKRRLGSTDLDRLRAAQQAWSTFRDLDCKAERGTYDNGTAGSFNYNSCMQVLAEQRLADLKRIYEEH